MRLDFRTFQKLIAVTGAATLMSCSSASIKFQSAPEKAQVYAHSLGTAGEMLLLGDTPLTISASDLNKKLGASGPVLVEFRKPGHLTSKLFVTDLSSTALTVNTELVASNGLEDMDKLNNLIDQVFESQRLARALRPDDALKALAELKKTYPQVAAIYELEGGIFYMGKKYKEALDSYGQAIKYNPKSSSSIRIHDALEILLGLRKAGAATTASAAPATAAPVPATEGAAAPAAAAPAAEAPKAVSQ